jgi:hypothetical protein
MTAKAAEKAPTGTKVKATDTKASATDTKAESTDTKGWVYRCSCGKEYEKEDQLGGHRSHYRNDKADHKNLGFGPSLKAVETPPEAVGYAAKAVADPESVSTTEPVEYVSDKDAGKSKPKDKKAAGEKVGRTTTNIEEDRKSVV